MCKDCTRHHISFINRVSGWMTHAHVAEAALEQQAEREAAETELKEDLRKEKEKAAALREERDFVVVRRLCQ